MAAYNVYLANLGGWKIDTTSITSIVQGYFDAIIKKNPKGFDSAKVQWASSPPTMTASELLVYFVKDSSDSILMSMSGFKAPMKGKDGTTFWNSTVTASEVYVGVYREKPRVLANLAMHEMMHNKAHLANALHTLGGMAVATVTDATLFTDANATLMASKLPDANKQWTDGFSLYNDPLRGI